MQTTSKQNAINFNSEEFKQNRYRLLAAMQAEQPIMHLPQLKCFIVTGYQAGKTLLFSQDTERTFLQSQINVFGQMATEQLSFQVMNDWILFSNPPRHTQNRKKVVKVFDALRTHELKTQITEVVNEQIDFLQEKDYADLVEDYAHVIPFTIICNILGIPQEDRPHLQSILFKDNYLSFILDLGAYTQQNIITANSFFSELLDYFKQLFMYKIKHPADDLISSLLANEQQLSEMELFSIITMIFLAGHETSSSSISSGICTLLQHPNQLLELINQPQLIESAVDEIFRYEPAIQFTARTLKCNHTISDYTIPVGSLVMICIAAMNRDPSIFENPAQFDISRINNKHLTFGGGIHYCLGAQLARAQTTIAIRALFRRFPNLKIAADTIPEWSSSYVLRGLKKLYVKTR